MVKLKLPKNLVSIAAPFLIIVTCVITYYLYNGYTLQYRPHVKSMHVINLDKDISRWNSVKSTKLSTELEIQRWTATYGKDISEDDLARQGVGYAMTRSGKGTYEEQGKDRRNQGVVGCFLSHRSLLKYLGNKKVPETYGHLILEDDITIPSNFLEPGDEWHKHYQSVPMDWDIVYMDVNTPVGRLVAPNIYKLKYSLEEKGNWGTHAYLVRHGAIKTKILPWLTYMIDAIDEQYKMKFNEWNVYAVVPGIITLNEVLSSDSTIQQNK